MDEKHQDFYLKMREKINSYLQKHHSKYADYLLLAPDLFHLLVRLSMDKRVPGEKKAKFIAVIAYFISPIDLMPEFILGPIGYLDDIALTAYVLNEYINENDSSVVRELWAGDQDILTTIKNILYAADRMIGTGLWRRIKSWF